MDKCRCAELKRTRRKLSRLLWPGGLDLPVHKFDQVKRLQDRITQRLRKEKGHDR